MKTRKHSAAEKKRCNSNNCAQSVVCTYCDIVGLPEQTALDIAGAYGTGWTDSLFYEYAGEGHGLK